MSAPARRAAGAAPAAPPATVRVRFFAGFREVVGAGELECGVAPGSTVRQLWDALVAKHPRLARWPASAAVNGAWATADRPLEDGDEVAYLPPVAGG